MILQDLFSGLVFSHYRLTKRVTLSTGSTPFGREQNIFLQQNMSTIQNPQEWITHILHS